MAAKFVALASILALAQAGAPLGYASTLSYAAPAVSYAAAAPAISYGASGGLSYAAPAVSYAAPALSYAAPVVKAAVTETYAPAHYDFGYAVNDPHTGDIKNQQESRRGDVVQGSYSLVESDGTRRIVEYAADGLNGFNAVVHKEPLAVKAVTSVVPSPAIANYAAPAIASYAAPAVAKIAAPLAVGPPNVGYAARTIASYATPAVTSYAAPTYASYASPAVTSYAAPAVASYSAPALGYAGSLAYGGLGYSKALLH